MFKYYLKQFKRIDNFKYWDLMDKLKFIGISNLLCLALLSVITTVRWLTFLISLGMLMSIGYIVFLTIESAFSKTVIRKKDWTNSMKGYLLTEVDKMNGVQFEELLLHLFKHQGYFARRNSDSQAFGADLLLKKGSQSINVHTKKYSDKIEISDVKELIGAAEYNNEKKKWIVTNSYFTKAAIVQANMNKIRLFDRDDLLEMLKDYHLHSIRLWKKDTNTSKTAKSKRLP